MGTTDKHLVKYFAFKLLTMIKELGRYTFYPKCLKPSDIFFDKNFDLKVGFLKAS